MDWRPRYLGSRLHGVWLAAGSAPTQLKLQAPQVLLVAEQRLHLVSVGGRRAGAIRCGGLQTRHQMEAVSKQLPLLFDLLPPRGQWFPCLASTHFMSCPF